jgi:hypothetical protein
MKLEAGKTKTIALSSAAIDAEVDLCATGGVYFLQAHFNVGLPAHQTCPYSPRRIGGMSMSRSRWSESDLISVPSRTARPAMHAAPKWLSVRAIGTLLANRFHVRRD